MSDSPEERHLTYDDAATETGHSAEALRKMLARGKLRRGRVTNSGRPTIALTQVELDSLRAGQPTRTEPRPTRTSARKQGLSDPDTLTFKALSDHLQAIIEQGQATESAAGTRLVATLERSLQKAEQDADMAKATLEVERASRDAERITWSASLDGLTAELEANRAGRTSDRRIAIAAVRRIRQQGIDTTAQLAAVQEQLARLAAGQGVPAAAVENGATRRSLKAFLTNLLTRITP